MTKVNKTISLDAHSAAIAANMDNFSEWIRMVLKTQDEHGNCTSCGINKHAYDAYKKQVTFFRDQFNYAYARRNSSPNFGSNHTFEYSGSRWAIEFIREV
jgi:hypothetical protein